MLFGGVDYFENIEGGDQTWTYDFGENTWVQRHPAVSPSARGWHDLAYDEEEGAIVLLGGGTDRFHFTDEAWIYRTRADRWSQVHRR